MAPVVCVPLGRCAREIMLPWQRVQGRFGSLCIASQVAPPSRL